MFIPTLASAQGVAIGAGDPVPHTSAILDLQSTSKGLLVPRMSTQQREEIVDPAAGLLVYDTDLGEFWYWADDDWFPLAIGGEAGWSTFGNDGTDPWYNFIGTRDSADLRFRVNNEPAGEIAISSRNTAMGHLALRNNVVTLPINGIHNTAIGSEALLSNVNGSSNTAVGYRAIGLTASGGRNTAVGGSCMLNTTGNDNSAVGYNALSSNRLGSGNVAMGYEAMPDLGADLLEHGLCIGIGRRAARFVVAADFCTFLGASAGISNITMTNSTYVGYQAPNTASNQVRLGNTAVTSIGGQVGWTTLSDARFKRDVIEDVKGLDLILRLRPVTYTVDATALSAFLKEDEEGLDERGKALMAEARQQRSSTRTTGFLAQEVEQAAKEVGYDFSGVDAPKNEHDHYGLRYAEFVVPLVKAVQEQQVLIERLQQRLEEESNARLELERRVRTLVPTAQQQP
jgi:hypothetical protein